MYLLYTLRKINSTILLEKLLRYTDWIQLKLIERNSTRKYNNPLSKIPTSTLSSTNISSEVKEHDFDLQYSGKLKAIQH